MKYAIAILSALSVSAISAELVLDNGETIAIEPNEKVYITKKQLYTRGTAVEAVNIDEAVVVIPPAGECSLEFPDLCDVGSVEYCTYKQEAWDGTPTFESQDWLSICDTNGNSSYKYCEDYTPFLNGYTFEDQNFVRYCPTNPDFNPLP
jgi:hypothetical protein